MRTIFLAVLVATLSASMALADPPRRAKSDNAVPPGKLLPVKGAGAANSCAAFGPGFVKVDGTDTCVKVGGAVSIEAGGSMGPR
ncbi:porin [Bradyrhizobium canariense]|uniref:Porin subfamily protein n=1 Tax=Bradyrhizobium canariense TaxID=255045 RepID=A0A1H1QW91_9BRAD|nr:porin [Bradyrhizobium canariense]SDS27656.1 Porin subfamily protein [Bradyrhizobium canariense]